MAWVILSKMNPLPKNVLRQLTSAHGWLNLGNWQEALAEVESLPACHQKDPLLLGLRVEICRVGKDWAKMAELSRHLTLIEPHGGGHWLNYSYGLRRSEGLEAAKEVLERGKDLFPKLSLIRFNLACYCAQLGLLDKARFHLAEAMAMNANYREAALQDPDLEPLWPEIRET